MASDQDHKRGAGIKPGIADVGYEGSETYGTVINRQTFPWRFLRRVDYFHIRGKRVSVFCHGFWFIRMHLCRRYLADTAQRLMETLTVTSGSSLQYPALQAYMRSASPGFPRGCRQQQRRG